MKKRDKIGEAAQGVAFVLPTVIIMTIFMILPIVYAFYLSFNKVSLVGDVQYQFIGFKNYLTAF
jgi:multiple sugar transport system permease protein